MRNYDKCHIFHLFWAGDPSLLGNHDDTNNNDDEHLTVYTSKNFNIFSNFEFSALKKYYKLSQEDERNESCHLGSEGCSHRWGGVFNKFHK